MVSLATSPSVVRELLWCSIPRAGPVFAVLHPSLGSERRKKPKLGIPWGGFTHMWPSGVV